MKEKKLSEAKLKANKRYDEMNMSQIGIKAKKEDIEMFKGYASKLGITPSKFAVKAMLYCIKNNINFESEVK